MEMENLLMGPARSCLRQPDQDQLQIALLANLGYLLHSHHRQGTEGTRVICNSSMHSTVAKLAANMAGSGESAVIKLLVKVTRAANTADTAKALAGTVTMGITSSAVDGATIMDTNR